MILEVVHVVVHLQQTLVRYGQRTSRRILHTTVEHHTDHRVLQHFGIDVEIGHVLVLSQCTENGVSRRTHATLQRQELLWNTALVHFLYEELCCQETDLIGYWVAVLEGTGLVGDVTLYDTDHLLLGNRDIGHTDAVADVLDGDSLAVRGIQRLIHVVNELGIGVMEAVQLQNHVLGQTGSCGRDTTSSCQIYMVVIAHFFNVAHLEDSPVQRTIEAIAQLLCHMAQVQVVIGNLTHVHVLAEIGVRGVRGTIEYCLGVCQVTIGALSGRGTGEDSHLELATGLVLSHSNLC